MSVQQALLRSRRLVWRTSSERIFRTNLDAPIAGEPPGEAVALVDVNADNVEQVFGAAPGGLTGAVAAARVRRGEYGLAARLGGDVIAHCWLTRGPWRLRDVGVEIRTEPTDGILYDAYTAPAHRRVGIMALLVREQAARARAQGWRRVFARAAATNLNSKSTLVRGGLTEIMLLRSTVVLDALSVVHAQVTVDDPGVLEWLFRSARPFRPGRFTWEALGRRGGRIVMPWRQVGSGA